MPYNPGTGIYTLPAVYLAVPGTTILATQHNTPLEDLEVANNYARPIIAGGTGSISAVTARGSVTGIATEGNIGAKGSNIASAAALPLVDNFNYFHVTGTTGITSISTRTSGQRILLEFEGILLITHSAGLFLQPPVNRTTAAGDVAEFVSEGAGNWRMVSYGRAAGSAPTQQSFSAGGTWTRPLNCIRAEFQATGAGGGSGGSTGAVGENSATGGGGGGFSGTTGIIDVSATVSAVVTIGAAGAAGAAAAGNGGNGGNTAITIGATTYTFGGGLGSPGVNSAAEGNSKEGGGGGVGTNVVGFGQPGGIGVSTRFPGVNATGGNGGSTSFGSGGLGPHVVTAAGSPGVVGAGFGAGAAGSCTTNNAINRAGAAGTGGYMRVTEYYS